MPKTATEPTHTDSESSTGDVRLIETPSVYLVGKQQLNTDEIDRFLEDNGHTWETDTEVGAELLAEMAGRICYVSYGKGRKTNREYLDNIIGVGHGSVLEHGVWNFMLTGVSRTMTHELVRHRAGFGYSQLSQRYVDESQTAFVIPPIIAKDAELTAMFTESVRASRDSYRALTEKLLEKYSDIESNTLRRKLARQAARSVLPNATETQIFVTANARALRHFIELRADEHADCEIRSTAVAMWRILNDESPNIFGDYEEYLAPDGTPAVRTAHRKV